MNATPHDAEPLVPLIGGLEACTKNCERSRLRIATLQANELRLLDEPIVLTRVDAAYRMILQTSNEWLLVRAERVPGQIRLMVKVTRGHYNRRPAVQTIRRRTKLLSADEWKHLSDAMRVYGFWERPYLRPAEPERDQTGALRQSVATFGGVNVFLEGFESTRRKIVQRPLDRRSDPTLRKVVRIFRELAGCGTAH